MIEAKVVDVKEQAKESDAFRNVLFTGSKSQLVIMSLRPGEDIGEEVHETVDQLLYAVKGAGIAVIAGTEHAFEKGSVFCVPAGTRHNVKNASKEPLKLFTVYAPPQHAPGTVHHTKDDAMRDEEHAHPIA